MKQASTSTFSSIEHSILHGLRLEWESILSYAPLPVQRSMAIPIFSLKNSEKSLAHWDASRREISFSRTFVLNYPWDSIKEVLIHEIAHQYASEVLKAHNETPHGTLFHKACHVFKANPEASGSYKPLTDRLTDNDEVSEQDRIMVKVKKLLALGNSMNRHEAESAMAKAHALIRKYNIDLFERDDERNFISVYLGEPALRYNREDYRLAHLLMEHYFVYGIWVPAYVKNKGKMGRVFEITGTPENVKIASYVHDFIRHHMDAAWESYNKGKNLNRSRKTDFSSGLVQGFQDRLNNEKKAQNPLEMSMAQIRWYLVKIDPKLSDYTSYRYPRVHNIQQSARAYDSNVTNAGKDIGKKLILNKAVEKHHEGRVLSLPACSD